MPKVDSLARPRSQPAGFLEAHSPDRVEFLRKLPLRFEEFFALCVTFENALQRFGIVANHFLLHVKYRHV